MSIKSLLQIILFLLIVIILGGIYFLYFYSGPLKNKEAKEKLLGLNETNKVLNNASKQDLRQSAKTIGQNVNLNPGSISASNIGEQIVEHNNKVTDILTNDCITAVSPMMANSIECYGGDSGKAIIHGSVKQLKIGLETLFRKV